MSGYPPDRATKECIEREREKRERRERRERGEREERERREGREKRERGERERRERWNKLTSLPEEHFEEKKKPPIKSKEGCEKQDTDPVTYFADLVLLRAEPLNRAKADGVVAAKKGNEAMCA